MTKHESTVAMLLNTSFVSPAAQAFPRNSRRVGLKQASLFAVVALSLTLSPASFASSCSTSDLTTSTQCLDDVSTGKGGNVDVEMMNGYGSGNGAFGLQWEQIDKIESFDEASSQYQDSSGSVFSFKSDDGGGSGDWKLNDVFEAGFSYAFVLKGGPGSATYLMDTNFTNGTWNNQGIDNKGLSNVTLFKSTSITAVPLPAAAWLFGSALIGFAGIGARRRLRRGG